MNEPPSIVDERLNRLLDKKYNDDDDNTFPFLEYYDNYNIFKLIQSKIKITIIIYKFHDFSFIIKY